MLPKRSLMIAGSVLTLTLARASPSFADRPTQACLDRLTGLLNAPTPTDRPDMMAIGDSLYNGVTSLTIDRARAENGAPALVARALHDKEFRVPEYPTAPETPILFDLERQLKKSLGGLVATIGRDVRTNINWWVKSYPAVASKMPDFFDDVSVAQADSKQMMCDTPKMAEDWIAAQPLQVGALGIPDDLTTWYYEVNERFILNPRLERTHDHLSQLAQVMVRQPRRLLINIGSNDGVWLMAFAGYPPNQPYKDTNLQSNKPLDYVFQQTSVAAQMNDLVKNMAEVARYVPRSTEFIYVNNLPAPSRVANLYPDTAWALQQYRCANDPGDPAKTATYFRQYATYLTLDRVAHLNWNTVCEMDRQVNAVNRRIEEAMRAVLGHRLVIVDANNLTMTYDGKHLGRGHGVLVNWLTPRGTVHLELDNRLAHPRLVGAGLDSGGLFGYDNLHPSAVGYALLAGTVLRAIADTEHLSPDMDAASRQSAVNGIQARNTPSVLRMGVQENITLHSIHTLLASPFVPSAPLSSMQKQHVTVRHIMTTVGKARGPTDEQP